VSNPRSHALLAKYLGITCCLLVTVFLIFSVCSAGQLKVSRVTHGATIKISDGRVEKTIRLVGIDAPEISHKKREASQPFGQAATKYFAGLVLNKTVEIKEYGQDRYGRTLGVVFVDRKNVNLEMVKAGYAEVYRGTPATGFDSAPYWKAEEEARGGKKGMWAQGDKYVSPREWRRVDTAK